VHIAQNAPHYFVTMLTPPKHLFLINLTNFLYYFQKNNTYLYFFTEASKNAVRIAARSRGVYFACAANNKRKAQRLPLIFIKLAGDSNNKSIGIIAGNKIS